MQTCKVQKFVFESIALEDTSSAYLLTAGIRRGAHVCVRTTRRPSYQVESTWMLFENHHALCATTSMREVLND